MLALTDQVEMHQKTEEMLKKTIAEQEDLQFKMEESKTKMLE